MEVLTIPVGDRISDHLPDFTTHTVTTTDGDWYTCVHIEPDSAADCNSDEPD